MKKFLVFLFISAVVTTSAQASMSYECWAYQNGSPYKMVHVSADNKSEAINKAEVKFNNLDIKANYVKCK